MKFKLFLFCCLCFAGSCYKPDKLPGKLYSDYELALPLISKTYSMVDFIEGDFSDTVPKVIDTADNSTNNDTDTSNNDISYPANNAYTTGEAGYPFFLGGLNEAQEIAWIAPHIVLEASGLPEGTRINVKVYVRNVYGIKNYFWLPENYSVTLENGKAEITASQPITPDEEVRQADKIYLSVKLLSGSAVSASAKLTVKMGVRMKFKAKFVV